MGKFLLGFALGAGVGIGLAMLLAPEPGEANRARLRDHADRLATGDESPLGSVAGVIQRQRNRLEEAIDAGRRASAERQAELYSALNLTPPDENPGQNLV